MNCASSFWLISPRPLKRVIFGFWPDDLQFLEKVPLAAALNRREFTKAEIDEGSYVAMGGILTDDLASQIRSESRSKFGRGFKPQLVPNPSGDPELFFYASLSKNLAFDKHFQVSDHPMRFGTNEVVAFGIERSHLANGDYVDTDPLWRQVRLLNFRTTNNFIIELKTKSENDTLILAKMTPQSTLAETVGEVLQRTKTAATPEADLVKLLVPKMDFSLTRTYDELLGKHLAFGMTNRANTLQIVAADQITRFRLDERGALLESEARLVATAETPPQVRVDLIFDRPFLVQLQRVGARTPYFALWIDNAELLAPWSGQ